MSLELRPEIFNASPYLRFERLIMYLEHLKIPVKNCNLIGCFGMAIDKGIFIDVEKIFTQYDARLVFFTILHEAAHYKTIQRIGKSQVVKMLAEEDFEVFANQIIDEEIIADRYASRLFLRMNGVPFPAYYTQQLDQSYYRDQYKKGIRSKLYKLVSTEEDYDNLWPRFIASN